jgi:hypothetical protein
MNNTEERVWAYLQKHGASADALEVSLNCDVTEEEAQAFINRISAPNLGSIPTRSHNVGKSDYAQHRIQPWDIWLEYNLNPWDADIIKRVLRDKPGERRLDYEKIKHVCDERIRQLDAEDIRNVDLERKESPAA